MYVWIDRCAHHDEASEQSMPIGVLMGQKEENRADKPSKIHKPSDAKPTNEKKKEMNENDHPPCSIAFDKIPNNVIDTNLSFNSLAKASAYSIQPMPHTHSGG
jgi:hypothetical protein